MEWDNEKMSVGVQVDTVDREMKVASEKAVRREEEMAGVVEALRIEKARVKELEREVEKARKEVRELLGDRMIRDGEIEEANRRIQQEERRHRREIDRIVANHATEILQLELDITILESVIRGVPMDRPRTPPVFERAEGRHG